MVVAAALLLASVAAAPSKPHLLFVLVGACAPPPARHRDRSPTLSGAALALCARCLSSGVPCLQMTWATPTLASRTTRPPLRP